MKFAPGASCVAREFTHNAAQRGLMAEPTIWWMLAGAAVALELLTGTFYLLMFALGLFAKRLWFS